MPSAKFMESVTRVNELINERASAISSLPRSFKSHSIVGMQLGFSSKDITAYCDVLGKTDALIVLIPFGIDARAWLKEKCIAAELVYSAGTWIEIQSTRADSSEWYSFVGDERLRLLVPTSGSTGQVKLVGFEFVSLAKAARNISRSVNEHAGACVSLVPFCYSFGLSVLHSALYAGREIETFDNNLNLVRRMVQMRAQNVFGTPQVIRILGGLRTKHRFCFGHLFQAGGPLSSQETYDLIVQDDWPNKFQLTKMYGQTECGPRITAGLVEGNDKTSLLSVGKAIAGVEIQIDAETQEILVDTEHGMDCCLEFDGSRWLKKPSTRLIRTGDSGYITVDGQLIVTGRLSRFVKINDIRIGLDWIESRLNDHFGKQFVVVETDDVVCVVSVGEDSLRAIDISAVMTNMGISKRDFRYFPDQFARFTSNGKPAYGQMKKIIADELRR